MSDDALFGVQNLPWGVVSDGERTHPAVRIGDHALLLDVLARAGLFADIEAVEEETFDGRTLAGFMAAGPEAWSAVRQRLQELLADPAPLVSDRVLREGAVRPLGGRLRAVLPFAVADFVDGYGSLHHATNTGRIFRPDGEPLLPNWRHLPVGYHGRAGTVLASGTPVRRPMGLRDDRDGPTFGPTRRLDFELEVGAVVGVGSTAGEPISPDALDQHVFGFCLVNDWSARDIQAYEARPLGPYLGKSFATSIGAWITPVEAVASAFTTPPPQDPPPPGHLHATRPWGLRIELEATIQTRAMEQAHEPPHVVTRTQFADQYWTLAQQFAHATSNGTPLRTGDLFASGTVSGPEPDARGCLLERTWGGRDQFRLGSLETRTWLEDGDTVTLTGATELPDGTNIGWSDVTSTVHPT